MPGRVHGRGCTNACGAAIDTTLLKPGLRLAVGLSGGADSVALLRALAERSGELGLVLHAAHLHHGLRGEEADGDLDVCARAGGGLGLALPRGAGGCRRRGKATRSGQGGETIEEAARRLRYGWFRQLMASGEVEAVATAHTLRRPGGDGAGEVSARGVDGGAERDSSGDRVSRGADSAAAAGDDAG